MPTSASAGVDSWSFGREPGGQILAAALDGNDCVAASLGLTFRSTDGCRHWSEVRALHAVAVGDLAADVLAPRTFYEAGAGLWRTQDGGGHWQKLPGPKPTVFYNTVTTDPANKGVVWIVTEEGLPYRSTSSGSATDWTRYDGGLAAGGLTGLVVDAAYDGAAYGWSYAGGVYRLPTSSATWQPVNSGLTGFIVRLEAIASGVAAFTTDGVFLLANGSSTWAPYSSGLPAKDYMSGGASDAAGNLYAVDIQSHVWELQAGSPSWSSREAGIPGGTPEAVWADHARGGHALVGTAGVLTPNFAQGPLWRTDSAGSEWARAGAGIESVTVNGIAADPAQRGRVLAATENDGVQRTLDGGRTWVNSTGVSKEPLSLAIDPRRRSLVIAAVNGNDAARSLDGGRTWSPIAGHELDLVAFDRHGTAWAIENAKPLKSSNAGTTWSTLTTTGLPPAPDIRSILPDEHARGGLFAGLAKGLYWLPPGGTTWQPSGFASEAVYALAVDGKNTSVLYAGTTSGLYRSNDDGRVWHRVRSGRTDRIVTVPGRSGLAYALVGGIVLRTTDRGAHWANFARPPGLPVRDIAADAGGFTVYAGTLVGGTASWTVSHRPVLIGRLRLSGKTKLGKKLALNPAIDAAPKAKVSYTWLRCGAGGGNCTKIGGAHKSKYRLRADDVGHRLRARVFAKNKRGRLTKTSKPSKVISR